MSPHTWHSAQPLINNSGIFCFSSHHKSYYFCVFKPHVIFQKPGTTPSGIKVTGGEEREKRTKLPLLGSTTFCLQYPRAAHATHWDQHKFTIQLYANYLICAFVLKELGLWHHSGWGCWGSQPEDDIPEINGKGQGLWILSMFGIFKPIGPKWTVLYLFPIFPSVLVLNWKYIVWLVQVVWIVLKLYWMALKSIWILFELNCWIKICWEISWNCIDYKMPVLANPGRRVAGEAYEPINYELYPLCS